MGKKFSKRLCAVELDRVTAAEICIDELLTIFGRHNEDGPIYNFMVNLSAELNDMLVDADGPVKRRSRLMRVRKTLTDAFPMTDADLGVAP